MTVSCMDFKDLYERVDQLEQKVAALEELNTTVSGLSTTIGALKNNVYVKEVTETAEGYVIKFSDNTQAVIRDGVDGEDGTTPTIGVKEEGGELVWTVNDKVVKDESGKAVPATVKVPEFKFENNKWWYRFGPTDSWKDCGEKTGHEPSITETEEFVIITIGDKSVQIPKEVVSPAIEEINHVLAVARRLFIPVGKSLDLKEWFEVAPEGALKSMVEYTYPEDAPFTISDKGVLTANGTGPKNVNSVTISAKNDPSINITLYINTGETPNNEEIPSTVDADQRIDIFRGSLEEYNTMYQSGNTSNFNPFNNSHASIETGAINFRLGLPVDQNTNLTMENARLHFMFYVSNPAALESASFDNAHFLEVTSSSYDANEINFDLPLFVPDLKAGWNEVDLPFSAAGNPNDTNGPFDITKVSFIRFVCPIIGADPVVFQVKDLFAYVPDAPAQITIDGDLSDWAKVKGVTNDAADVRYVEFKMASDADNLYFYTRRTTQQYNDIWNGGGYVYYAFDFDDNMETGGGTIWGNGPYELIFVIWPFGGSSSAPAFAATPLGDSTIQPSGDIKTNYKANGKFDSATGVELEFSIPRADLPAIPNSQITVYSWGNKGGENMKNNPLKITL